LARLIMNGRAFHLIRACIEAGLLTRRRGVITLAPDGL
jgi:hypothetical protein